MTISVIIPTRDRGEELMGLLAALEAQTRRPDEVVIVDSSAPPLDRGPYAARLKTSSLMIKYLHSLPGANRQRNFGARESRGELLFFFDDDVAPEPNFIATMAETFARHPEYHGGMGTCAPIMRRRSPGTLLCQLFLLQHEHGDGTFRWSGMPQHPYGSSAFMETEVLDSGKMALRRSVFSEDQIEFDERLTLSQQDVDFSRRLSRQRRLFFNPQAKVEHLRSPVGRAGPFELGRRYMFNYRYLYFKNTYPYARWTILAHWWAVVGLFAVAALTRRWEAFRGYASGLAEHLRMRQGRSEGLFETP